jgi:hypothetical protein
MCECLHNPAQVIQITAKPIHAMDDHRVAASHKAHHQFQRGRFVSLPDALSVKVLSSSMLSNCRSVF